MNFTSEPNPSFGYQEAEQLGRKFKPLDHFIRSIFLFMSRINSSSFGPNLWDTSQLSMCENELLRKKTQLQKNDVKKHLSSSLPLLCSSVCPVKCWETSKGNGKSMKKFICPIQFRSLTWRGRCCFCHRLYWEQRWEFKKHKKRLCSFAMSFKAIIMKKKRNGFYVNTWTVQLRRDNVSDINSVRQLLGKLKQDVQVL